MPDNHSRSLPHPDRDDTMSSISRRALGPLLILLVGLAFLYPLWTRHEIVYSKHSDIIAEHLSIKAVGRRAVVDEGRFPLWNPSMNGGAPAFANPQSMYIYPFDLLFLALPLDIATNVVILLNILLAGLSMYLFGRGFFKHPSAALFCALAYMLSYRYLAIIHAGWLPKMSMYALTPLLFWSVARVLRRPNARGILVLAFVVALAFLQGDMQQLYYSAIGCAVYILFRLPSVAGPIRVRTCLHLVIGGLLGVMLAAPALLPRLEYASLSTRTETNYTFFLASPPTFTDLSTLLDPDDRCGDRDEFWENNFYFGFWLFPLCVMAFFGNRTRSILLLLAGAVMVIICFDTVLLKWLYHYLPGFSLFRQSPRILLLSQFVLLLLAGLGVEALYGNASRVGCVLTHHSNVNPGLVRQAAPYGNTSKGKLFVFLAAICVTVVLGIFAATRWDTTSPYAVCGLLVVIGLLITIRGSVLTITIGLLCLLPILDSTLRIHPLITTLPLRDSFPNHEVHKLLNRNVCQGRIMAAGRTSIPYGMAGYFGIDMINGYASLNLKHYIEYMSILQYGARIARPARPVVWTDCRQITTPSMLRALDVRYIVANRSSRFDRIGYKKIARYEQVPVFVFYEGVKPLPVEVWRMTNPLGPAYYAKAVDAVEDEARSLNAITKSTSVLNAHVMGMNQNATELDYAGGNAEMVQRGINQYEYKLESRGNNFLILSQIWYPGWKATLNGQDIKLYRTNHALLGCFVPPGQHRLVLEMTSPPLRYGIMIAGAALIVLLILFIVAARRQMLRPLVQATTPAGG